MECEVELNPEIRNIKNFKILLERYKNYQSCIRDIKINTVLGQKCLFEVEEINPPIYCEMSNEQERWDLLSLSHAALSINTMSFKIDDNMNIISLNIKYDIINSKIGKLFTELSKIGIPIKIHTKVLKNTKY